MNILGEAVVSVMGVYLEPSEGVYTDTSNTEATAEQYTQIEEAVVTFTALNNQNIVNTTARDYLASTDWYIARKSETGTEVPSDILIKRAEARAAVVSVA
jgi:hypothetical protein